MKGYVVIDTEIIDQEAYAEFVGKVPDALAAHGGRFLVRTSDVEPIEGGWEPQRLVIMEFDDIEEARAFVTSDVYAAFDELRHRATRSRIVVAEGSAPAG